MRIGFEVFVLIVLCVGETLAWNRNNPWSKEKLLSSTKYSVIPTNVSQRPRTYFYWESSPLAPANETSNFEITFKNINDLPPTPTTEAAANSTTNKKKRKSNRKKLKNKGITSNDVNGEQVPVQKHPKHKNPRKKNNGKKRHNGGKKKSKQKNFRKNRRKGLEIPLKAEKVTDFSSRNIETDASIQSLISKLNSNPELAYENLLGKDVKISNHKLTNDPINVSSPSLRSSNSSDYGNDIGILLAPRERKSDKITSYDKSVKKKQFYDSRFNIVAPTTTETIFKGGVKEAEGKTYNKKENSAEDTWKNHNGHSKEYVYPKINYSELLKTRDVNSNNNTNHFNPGDINTNRAKANQILEMLDKLSNYSGNDKGYAHGTGKCQLNNGGCAHFCNEINSPRCSCLEGFELGTDGKSCFDMDECSKYNGGCEDKCYNTQGSYYCGCSFGLRIGDNLKSCEDINECLLRNGHGPCQDTCANTFGSYYCGCSNLNGTRLAEDKHACEDVNECKEGRSGCSHGCINTLGRAFCTCPNGMELENDWKTCYDINECDDEEISKQCNYGCLNTVGSYRCLELIEEQNDQIPVAPEHIVCPPLFPPKHGFFHCSRKKAALGFKTKDGRLRITNRPGTFCELVCPEGYKNVRSFRVTCSVDGLWIGDRSGKCSPFSKPKIKCPAPFSLQLKPGEEVAHITFPPPKTSVDWKYVEADPVSAKSLEAYLPQGHHWITFKATDPYSKRTAKCIIYIVVKKVKISL